MGCKTGRSFRTFKRKVGKKTVVFVWKSRNLLLKNQPDSNRDTCKFFTVSTKLYIHPKYYKHLKKRCSPKPFGQTKNGLFSGRLACTSSKTKILNKIGIYILILNYTIQCKKNWKIGHENMKKLPSIFFSVLAWLPKRPQNINPVQNHQKLLNAGLGI